VIGRGFPCFPLNWSRGKGRVEVVRNGIGGKSDEFRLE
jgi:hypothetical protein